MFPSPKHMYQAFSNIINDVYRLNDEVSPDNLDNKLKDIALKSKRKQSRICLHKSDEATIQIMYICHLRGCEVRIHKHLEFPEWIIFLKGKVRVIYFDNDGNSSKKLTIDTEISNGPVTLFIPKDIYHTLEFDKDSFFLEVKQGPFKKNYTQYLT